MFFSNQIISWYQNNKRDLPWRSTRDPYIIWLSEIILQQTRVNQGVPYFYTFSEHYPTVYDLGSAPEEEVLRHWQGLGYYSRGRNMLKAAQIVMKEYNGIFPSSYEELIKLPGIGEYTAAAISSFSANEPKAVVDGNVSRVLARYFAIEEAINSTTGKKLFQKIADEHLFLQDPGLHNQAIMEFGALQCKPRNPACVICPLRLSCLAFQNSLVDKLPIKIKATKSKNRYFNYFVIRHGDKILMQKRGPGDIWENLYELPLIESVSLLEDRDIEKNVSLQEAFGNEFRIIYSSAPIRHILSHQNIYARFFEIINIEKKAIKNKNCNYVLIKDLDKLAKSKLTVSFCEKYIK